MEFKITPGDLLSALDRLHNISQTKNVRPILANTLLDATGEQLKISTTDLEISITVVKPGTIIETGRITLPTQELYKLAGRLKSGEEIHFVEEENFWMTLSTGRSRFRLAGLDPEEYPELPVISSGQGIELTNKELGELTDHCLFAASTDINKKILNGILLETREEGQCLRMVGTDGHRLAVSETRREKKVEIPGRGIVLPSKGLKELRRILGNREGSVTLTVGDAAARVVESDFEMVMRYLEGNYPEYQRVIPESCRLKAVIAREPLAEALQRVSVFASDKYMGVKLDLTAGECKVSFSNPGVGEAVEELAAEYEGDPFTISFNARYLLDILSSLTQSGAELEFNESQSPCRIRESGEQHSQTHIVMPMML